MNTAKKLLLTAIVGFALTTTTQAMKHVKGALFRDNAGHFASMGDAVEEVVVAGQTADQIVAQLFTQDGLGRWHSVSRGCYVKAEIVEAFHNLVVASISLANAETEEQATAALPVVQEAAQTAVAAGGSPIKTMISGLFRGLAGLFS